MRLLDLDQFRKVVRQHGLVARDDRDAEYLVDRRREEGFVDLDLARFFRVADADLHDLRVGVLRFLHYLVDSLSDDAEPEQADFDFAHMLLVY